GRMGGLPPALARAHRRGHQLMAAAMKAPVPLMLSLSKHEGRTLPPARRISPAMKVERTHGHSLPPCGGGLGSGWGVASDSVRRHPPPQPSPARGEGENAGVLSERLRTPSESVYQGR